MNTRIKELRKSLDMTQTEFGAKLGVSRDVIKNVEYGQVKPSGIIVKSICSIFGVSEQWLTTGEGTMYEPQTEDERLAAIFGKLLSDNDDSVKKRLIKRIAVAVSDADEDTIKAVIEFAKEISKD